jgi:hypothetical protein
MTVFAALLPPAHLTSQSSLGLPRLFSSLFLFVSSVPLAPGMLLQSQIDLRENWRGIQKDQTFAVYTHFSGDGWAFVHRTCYVPKLKARNVPGGEEELAHIKTEKEILPDYLCQGQVILQEEPQGQAQTLRRSGISNRGPEETS